MDIYFKNLTADEGPAEKLVEDLMRLTYDAESLVKGGDSGAKLPDLPVSNVPKK